MTTPVIISLIAVGGTLVGTLIGSLGGALLQSRLAAGREVARDLRERCLVLYADAAKYAHYRDGDLDWLTGDLQYKSNLPRPSMPLDPAVVTAQMQVLAHQEVREAWDKVLAGWANLYIWLDDMDPRDEARNLTAPVDQPEVVALRQAVSDLQKAIRRAVRRN